MQSLNVMSNSNNIQKIASFITSKDNDKLMINQVNDEIGAFYQSTIKYIAELNDIKLDFKGLVKHTQEPGDLFEEEKIKIFILPNKKDMEQILLQKKQIVVLTDYKNIKKYQQDYKTINGYNVDYDIKFFIKNIIGIENEHLINFCLSTPQLTQSEVSKYLINNINYVKENSILEETNFILQIRKAIFDTRKTGDIRKLFLKIKEEAKYKKFSFLTF